MLVQEIINSLLLNNSAPLKRKKEVVLTETPNEINETTTKNVEKISNIKPKVKETLDSIKNKDSVNNNTTKVINDDFDTTLVIENYIVSFSFLLQGLYLTRYAVNLVMCDIFLDQLLTTYKKNVKKYITKLFLYKKYKKTNKKQPKRAKLKI